jgi:hypothetical protein
MIVVVAVVVFIVVGILALVNAADWLILNLIFGF